MNQPNLLTAAPGQDNGNNLEPLHPSLQASFVALPPAGVALTLEQLQAIFGGDRCALRDLVHLAYQSEETEAE